MEPLAIKDHRVWTELQDRMEMLDLLELMDLL